MLTNKQLEKINKLTKEMEEIQIFLSGDTWYISLGLFFVPKIKLFKNTIMFSKTLVLEGDAWSKIKDVLRERIKEIETELEKVTIREEIKC